MNIQLKQLTLINFKGIKELEIRFDHITNIRGENATGKTTIFDAFTWLLFGKDCSDRKDFEIKTLDHNGRPIEKLDHSVEGVLLVDGERIVIKRVLKEKWVKKRGTEIAEFTGNETQYWWDDVPLQAKEFQVKINNLIDEQVFKLITNTLYFNSLPWLQRRQALIDIAGELSDTEIAAGNPGFEIMLAGKGKKTWKEFKDQIAAEKKKLKDELDYIPARVDEATRAMPEPLDFAGIENQIATEKEKLAGIETQLTDSVKALKAQHDAINAKQREIHSLQTSISKQEQKLKSDFRVQRDTRETQLQDIKRLLRNDTDQLQRNKTDYLAAEKRIKELKTEQASIRDKWHKENETAFQFDDTKCNCPTCGQKLPEENITAQKEQLEKNFNANKIKDLERLTEDGKMLGKQIFDYEVKLRSIIDANEKLSAAIEKHESNQAQFELWHNTACQNEETELSNLITNDAGIRDTRLKIEALEKEIEALTGNEPDNTELEAQKASIQQTIEELNKKLNTREQIEKTKVRIKQLTDQEKDLARQIAELEGREFTIQEFTKAKITDLESRINGMFNHVSFKMFDIQINGGEVETCQTTYKGVPWSDLNNAARINCGLDIINTLCRHYNVTAPVFIDNAESITRLIPVDSQVVRLVVSEADKKLRVETETREVAA